MEWIWAGVAVVAGFVIGSAVSQLARVTLERRGGRLAQLAAPVASLVFSLMLVIGLLVALGIVRPESLDQLRDDTILFLPRVVSALIVVVLGGVVGTILSTAVRESIGRSMGRLGEQVPSIIKTIVSVFAAILAASQLGIDTTIINIAVAAAVFGLAASFALVVGFGSRSVAAEIAAGRALSRLIGPGDSVSTSFGAGEVLAMHATAVEVDVEGVSQLVPNSALTTGTISVTRRPTDDASASED